MPAPPSVVALPPMPMRIFVAAIQCGADEFAGAEARCTQGVALAFFKQGQAAGGGHFDDGGLAVSGEGELGLDGPAEGIVGLSHAGGGRGWLGRWPGRCRRRRRRWGFSGTGRRAGAAKSACDAIGSLCGGEGAFEGVGADGDFQPRTGIMMVEVYPNCARGSSSGGAGRGGRGGCGGAWRRCAGRLMACPHSGQRLDSRLSSR